jgi:hypothetical protein
MSICESCEAREKLRADQAAALATLQAENAELRRGSASCVDDDGTPFASARTWRKAYGEASDERDTARAEAATLRERLEAAERERPKVETAHRISWEMERARATAAEGERDRLREALWEVARPQEPDGICVVCGLRPGNCTDWGDRRCPGEQARAALAAIPHTEGEAPYVCRLYQPNRFPRDLCYVCGGTEAQHSRGEASAPPKESTP